MTVLWAPHGDNWRALRRFLAVELFSSPRVAARAADRRAGVPSLVEGLLLRHAGGGASASPAAAVTLRLRLFELVLDVMLRAPTGVRGHGGADVRGFQEDIEESFTARGAPRARDFYPALRWGDRLLGVDAPLARLHAKRDALVGGLIDNQRRRRRDAGGRDSESRGVIEELLSLQEIDPEYYTDTVIKGVIIVVLSAVTDTSALTIEWAMAKLLTHPEALGKTRPLWHCCRLGWDGGGAPETAWRCV